jgi:hypothetical protein
VLTRRERIVVRLLIQLSGMAILAWWTLLAWRLSRPDHPSGRFLVGFTAVLVILTALLCAPMVYVGYRRRGNRFRYPRPPDGDRPVDRG